jgi:hypothetical protein
VLSASHGGLTPPLLVGNASAKRIMRIPTANSIGTSLRSGTRPAHMRIHLRTRLRSPRVAYAPRSWSGMRALGELCVFQLHFRPEHRCGRERAQNTCVFQRWIRSFTTGGLRPPLLSLVQRASAGRKTIFAVHKRTFTRAAGVSPPWQAKRDGAVSLPETKAVENSDRQPAVVLRTASASAMQ